MSYLLLVWHFGYILYKLFLSCSDMKLKNNDIFVYYLHTIVNFKVQFHYPPPHTHTHNSPIAWFLEGLVLFKTFSTIKALCKLNWLVSPFYKELVHHIINPWKFIGEPRHDYESIVPGTAGTITFCLIELRSSASCDINYNARMVYWRYLRGKVSLYGWWLWRIYRRKKNKSMSCDALNLLMPDFSGTILA